MKDIIKLIYVKDGHEYSTDIDRTVLFEQMEYFAKSYLVDGTNYNAQKLCDIIPNIDTIKISYSVIETRDIPFFEYTLKNSPVENVFKLRRPYKIIWDIFEYHCEKAMEN